MCVECEYEYESMGVNPQTEDTRLAGLLGRQDCLYTLYTMIFLFKYWFLRGRQSCVSSQ